jgi:hypothetical protein
MSKEFARETIEKYLLKNGGILPIKDAVIYTQSNADGIVMQGFTFKYLLCVAYDLQPEN